jgi:ribonuclease J
MTRDFIERAIESKPIALLIEGTRITEGDSNESEEMVYTQSNKIVSQTDRLVLADFNFKDVDRLRTFYNTAKMNGRKLVVKLSDAYFLKYLSKDKFLNVPKIDDENIIIYLPKRGSGSYLNSDYNTRDGQFLGLQNAWTAERIVASEQKVLCAIGFHSFTSLIDMKPKPGALYIHSSSEPYNEEQELSQQRLDAWIDHFGMAKFQSHCSGHAGGKDLLQAASEINSKRIFPVHTENPQAFQKSFSNVTIIKEFEKYFL